MPPNEAVIEVVSRPMSESWLLQIWWDDEHSSPPIGPYKTYSQAKQEAVRVRKALKQHGKAVRRIDVGRRVSPSTMWGWDDVRTDFEESDEDGVPASFARAWTQPDSGAIS